MTSGSVLNGKCTPYRVIVKVTSKFSKKQLLARVVLFIKVNRTLYRVIAKVTSKFSKKQTTNFRTKIPVFPYIFHIKPLIFITFS